MEMKPVKVKEGLNEQSSLEIAGNDTGQRSACWNRGWGKKSQQRREEERDFHREEERDRRK
ncbi:terminase [Sesbania bispinosa]|nr:terminase [Sesbania bispinosa]